MKKETVRRGVSKAQWLEAAMKRLCDHSVADITVEGLAKELGIAKSGFYWHFKSREEMLDALLDHWVHEIRQFALRNERASRAVKKSNNLRVDFIRDAFSEIGFAGDDLEMRTMLFACYHTWEASMFQGISRKRRKALIGKRIDLLTTNIPS